MIGNNDRKHDEITRRTFLARAAALGISTGLASNIFASAAHAATPKKGGFLKFGMFNGSQNDSLDPGTWPATFTQCGFNGSLYNNLTEIAADGNIVPDLAESFEPSNGAKTWVFKLRKGVTFHDGKSLVAEDVKESFLYHMGAKSTSGAKSLLSQIESIKSDGPHTIVFNLTSGSADFPFLVADYHLSIMQAKKEGGIYWQKGIGTGSFILEHFAPGTSLKMKRNPNYHKEGKPYIDGFEFINIPDAAARTNALVTGGVDYIAQVARQTIPLLQRNSKLSILRTPSLSHHSFDMDTSRAPFNDPNVRLALKHALNREDIVRKAYLGEATNNGLDNPVAPVMTFYKAPTPQHEYNIVKAKEYLRKAGRTSLDVDLSVATTAFPGALEAAALFKEHAAKAGININIIKEADDGYWQSVWLKKPFVGVNWFGRPTCDWLFSSFYSRDAKWNSTHWGNDRFNQLLVQARSETDKVVRAAKYAEMQQLIHDDGGSLIVAFVSYIDALNNKIGHGVVGGTFPNDNLRMTERWWVV